MVGLWNAMGEVWEKYGNKLVLCLVRHDIRPGSHPTFRGLNMQGKFQHPSRARPTFISRLLKVQKLASLADFVKANAPWE
jgi:hypothetical protein